MELIDAVEFRNAVAHQCERLGQCRRATKNLVESYKTLLEQLPPGQTRELLVAALGAPMEAASVVLGEATT